MSHLVRTTLACVFVATIGLDEALAQNVISYNRDVRPILSNSCFACHGPDAAAREARLRLDERQSAVENRGGYFAIDPGNAQESEVMWRLRHDDPDEIMPPPDSGKTITPEQIEIIARWIDSGAKYEPHWSYVPPKRVDLPVTRQRWSSHPIDRFVLRRLENNGLEPAPEAEAIRLVRRVYFDLTGLPPTPKEVDAFLAEPETTRYEALVTRLTESSHYGERMALEWLDVVRFADTNGYHSDDYRDMHPYRDYVIDAFNANKPYDTFTIEQIAGDLLPTPTKEQIVAAGYNRLNQITSEGGAQPKEYLAKYMADRVRNLGSVWMGATLGCAECHDHKYDPFTARDFYRFGAFFADIEEVGKYEHGKNNYAPFMRFPTDEHDATLAEFERELDKIKKNEPQTARDRTIQRRKIEDLQEKIDAFLMTVPSSLITKAVEPREVRVLPRGNWMDDSGEIVTAGTPGFLPPLNAEGDRATRLDLARWIVDERNPLTARTFVNRLWAQFFGTGLSPVLDDLGRQGQWPTHPDLLDWLAVEFMESDWDIKHMVRLILTSKTYRQSTQRSPKALERDPTNRLLAGQNPRRLPAELVRDNALAISGLLNRDIGGPSVRPYQPEGYYKDTYKSVGVPHTYEPSTGDDQYRRGMYTFWKRTFLHPSLLAFDAPTREECTAGRTVSNTPQQALVLLNNPSFTEAARVFATRVLDEAPSETGARFAYATRLALSREATEREVRLLWKLLDSQHAHYRSAPEHAQALVSIGFRPPPDHIDPVELAAWTQVCRALLNTHETITRY